MKRRTYEQFRDSLSRSVAAALDDGRTIYDCCTIHDTCCCPLGSSMPPHARFPLPSAAAKHWRITTDQAWAFVRGFENTGRVPRGGVTRKFYDLGAKYRNKYVSA